jgi:hypothetical protein
MATRDMQRDILLVMWIVRLYWDDETGAEYPGTPLPAMWKAWRTAYDDFCSAPRDDAAEAWDRLVETAEAIAQTFEDDVQLWPWWFSYDRKPMFHGPGFDGPRKRRPWFVPRGRPRKPRPEPAP